MRDLGVRLQLLVGPTVPLPAPYALLDALSEVEVRTGDRDRDTFQLTLSVGKDSLVDYGLLRAGVLDPPARVVVGVLFGPLPEVLIDGVVTDHQLAPSYRPGESTLRVTGEDVSFQLDRDERSATFPNQSDADIVSRIVAGYGLVPDVADSGDAPSEERRVPTQQGTDLAFIRKLAADHGFVFYVEPTAVAGVTTAYWGPQRRGGAAQPALTVGAGPDANVIGSINFGFDALAAATPEVTIVDPATRIAIRLPLPTSILAALTSRPATPLRTVVVRDAANLDAVQAALRGLVTAEGSADSVTATGELDAVRYGRVLRARRPVDVRGAGGSYDGRYYVQQVTHHIRLGEYRQAFTLTREGLGAQSQAVTP
jgi:hypothetical protein